MTANSDWSKFIVLLIDIQEDFWSPQVRGAFPEFPNKIEKLLAFCRDNQLDVIHLHASFAPDQSNWMSRYRLRGEIPCVAGTGGEDVLPFAAPAPGERLIKKQTFDCFLQPKLLPLLRSLDKRFVLAAGIETSVCVLTTALSATQHGFLCAVIGDCCADTPEKHQHVLTGYPFGFDVVGVDDLEDANRRWRQDLAQLQSLA